MNKKQQKALNCNVDCCKNKEEKLCSDSTSTFYINRIASRWLSTKLAVKYLDISENAFRIKAHRGQVKSFKFGGWLKFKVEDLDSSFNQKEIL